MLPSTTIDFWIWTRSVPRDFFYACYFGSKNNREKQIEYLKSGLKANELDADVLIALYRVPDLDAELRTRPSRRFVTPPMSSAVRFNGRRTIGGLQPIGLVDRQHRRRPAQGAPPSQESLRIKGEEPGYLRHAGTLLLLCRRSGERREISEPGRRVEMVVGPDEQAVGAFQGGAGEEESA